MHTTTPPPPSTKPKAPTPLSVERSEPVVVVRKDFTLDAHAARQAVTAVLKLIATRQGDDF